MKKLVILASIFLFSSLLRAEEVRCIADHFSIDGEKVYLSLFVTVEAGLVKSFETEFLAANGYYVKMPVDVVSSEYIPSRSLKAIYNDGSGVQKTLQTAYDSKKSNYPGAIRMTGYPEVPITCMKLVGY
ncbi:MAG TPA: hypothetical protein DCL41_09430 [Bdellovibrionales bacterium]|nr:hypothetical protein [Pseudobdellovibrionaceae bacterium]HAG92082.1 hypothetical protein [Bdellovibrionales bacterium]|tara:strand:+ start:2561 stop:2947 length:387 start_codon:yes stop_codon:yes gene_type:complete